MTVTCRLTDDWLPLPADVLADLGWAEGDQLELEILDGVLIVTRLTAEALADADL